MKSLLRPRRLALLCASGAGCVCIVAYVALSVLVAPRRSVVGPAPRGFEDVEFADADGRSVRGWLSDADPAAPAVLLLHGSGGDRRAMLARARFLRRAGYGCLLLDLAAHGESAGERVSFGHHESSSARAGLALLRSRGPGRELAAIGVSLGAAACLLGTGPLEADALVLESLYPTIEAALDHRLRLRVGPLAPLAAALLLVQAGPRFGLTPDQLRPLDRIGEAPCPVLVLGGDMDERTPVAETQRLFDAAPAGSRLWLVAGAAHTDLHVHAPAAYEQRVLAFLAASLSGEPRSD